MKFCEICAARLSGNRDIEQLVNGNNLKASDSLKPVICARDCHLCLGILQRENFEGYKRAFRSSVESWPLNSNQGVSDVQLLISGTFYMQGNISRRICVPEIFLHVETDSPREQGSKAFVGIVCIAQSQSKLEYNIT